MSLVQIIQIAAVLYALALLILAVAFIRFQNKQRTQREAGHGHTDNQESIRGNNQHHQAGSRLVPDPEGPAPQRAAVEIEELNANGEVPGCGAAWACANFGHNDHNYFDCTTCRENYHRRLHIQHRGQSLRSA